PLSARASSSACFSPPSLHDALPIYHLVALALPLLLVGGDPGGPPGGHLLAAVEVAKQQAAFELVTATHAPLVILLLSEVAITTDGAQDRKSTRLNSSHVKISYAVFCLK